MSPIIFQSRKQSCKDFPPPQPPFPHLKMKSTPSGYAWNCYLPVKIMVSQTLRHGYLLKPFRIYFNLCMGDDGCEMDGKWITRCLAWFPPSFTLALCLFVTHFFFFFFILSFLFSECGQVLIMFDLQKIGLKIQFYSLLLLTLSYYT